MEGLLDDLTVVDISSFAAAPTAAAMLADLGARVIKVEAAGGDPIRGMLQAGRVAEGEPKVDHPFEFMNRGKESIELDLRSDEGVGVIHRLVGQADVVILNMLSARRQRFSIDVDQLHAIKPDLVIGLLTGYGEEGPETNRPGYDITAFFSRSGLLGGLTQRGGEPPAVRPAQGDHTTSMAFFGGILAALRRRDRTGEGQVVEVSLMHTAAFTIGVDLAAALIDGRTKYSRGRHETITPMMQAYRCADDRWIYLAMPDRGGTWEQFCRALGRSDLADNPDYADAKGRYTHNAELMATLDQTMATKTFEEWADILDRNDCIWGPVNDPALAASDPQMQAAGVFTEIDHPEAGTFRTVAVPFKIRGDDTIRPRGAAPVVGQHGEKILAELGYDADQIASLHSAGVVGGGS
jgi:crotonobetainyl-CoA:carnitine CoA-transferase CaiB-like acyl-CoA transferase